MRWLMIIAALISLLTACDGRVPQTVVVRASVANASLDSLWLAEADQCAGDRITPALYRDGLWIFSLSSIRGGVGAVTQQLVLCYQDANASPTKLWHSLHGGGASFIVLACNEDARESCALYMDRHSEGTWIEPPQE
jgi:hypothetical protein